MYWVRWAGQFTRTGEPHSIVDYGRDTSDVLGVTWEFHQLHDAALDVRYLEPVTDGVDKLVFNEWESLALLAPLLLVAVGAATASTSGDQRLRRAVLQGAAIVVGYLPLAILTGMLAVWTPDVTPRIAIGVSFVDAVTLTGLAYPVVFGGVGGALAYSIDAATALVNRRVARSRP